MSQTAPREDLDIDVLRQLSLLKEGPVESRFDIDSIRDKISRVIPLRLSDRRTLMEWATRNKACVSPVCDFFEDVLADTVLKVLAEQNSKAAEEREEYPDANNFVVIKLPNSGQSTLMKSLDENLKRNLLVISADGIINYFGDPEFCKILQEKFGGSCKDNSWCGIRDKRVAPFIRGYFKGQMDPKAGELLFDGERFEGNRLVDDSGNICEDTIGKIGQFIFKPNETGPCHVKGELVNYKGFKLAVVDPKYDGEMPEVEEMWVCKVAGDTRLGMHRVGTAFLNPIESVEKKWLLEAKGPPVLGVNRLRADSECPSDVDDIVFETDGVYEKVARECGLRINSQDLEVVDYKLAESKLGKSISIKPAPGMHGFKLTWENNTSALVSSDVLIRAGVPYTYDKESVDFVPRTPSELSMKADIEGFGATSVVIGVRGSTSYARYEKIGEVGELASISDVCPADVRQKVIELLKRGDSLSAEYYISQKMEYFLKCGLQKFQEAMTEMQKCFDQIKGVICEKLMGGVEQNSIQWEFMDDFIEDLVLTLDLGDGKKKEIAIKCRKFSDFIDMDAILSRPDGDRRKGLLEVMVRSAVLVRAGIEDVIRSLNEFDKKTALDCSRDIYDEKDEEGFFQKQIGEYGRKIDEIDKQADEFINWAVGEMAKLNA